MRTFLTGSALVTALLVVCSSPALIVAWRRRKTSTIKRFLLASAGAGILFGGLGAVTSQKLVGQCISERNTGCVDSGFQGLVFLVAVIFLIVGFVRAASINNE